MHPLSSKLIENFQWPDGYKAAASLSWHMDADAGVLASGKKPDTWFTSFSEARYGITTALPRILELLKEFDIPGSFAFPAYVAKQYPDAVLDCVAGGHEIMLHGYLHENVALLSADEEEDVLARSIEALETITGARPVGWTAPSWGMNMGTIDLLHKYGLAYDNTLMEHDVPTVFEFSDGPLFEIPISTVLEDWQQFGVDFAAGDSRMASVKNAFSLWSDEMEGLVHYGGLFSPTFHPNLVGRPGTMLEMATFLSQFREGHGIWWANGAQIAKHCQTLHSAQNPR